MTSGTLAGKLAFVTGAGSGIGRAVCGLFAREGAKVIATDQNVKAAEDTVVELGGLKHISLELNVSNIDNVQDTFSKINKYYSMAPTIVVNAAGTINENSLLKMSEKQWDDIIDINLKGTFLIMQTAAKAMIASENSNDGSIVNVGSITSKVGLKYNCNYVSSKAGIEGLTKSAAQELSKYGIRVNAVLPGLTDTPLIKHIPESIQELIISRNCIKRLAQPIEIAEAILFLASKKSSYITGASIDVSGGLF